MERKSKKMKTSVLIFVLFAGFMIVGCFGGIYLYHLTASAGAEQVLVNQANYYFEAIAKSKANHVRTFLNEKKILAENLALIGKIEKLLLTDKTNPGYDGKVEAVNKRLQKTVDSIGSILAVGVIDKDGIVVASTDADLIGMDYSEAEFFQRTEKETVFKFVEDPLKGTFFGVGSPVKDPKTKEFLGMVEAFIDMEAFNDITLDRTGLGKTGEVYLINKDGYMITPSRFILKEETFLKRKVDTINSRNCLDMSESSEEHIGHEAVSVFKDYRNVNVVGAHAYIPEMQWCLLAEIDEEEALGQIKSELRKSAVISLIAIFIIMTFFIFLSDYFIRRLIEGNEKSK